MGIFGNDAQSQVDLDDLKARVATLEVAVASLQAQSGGVPYGSPQVSAPDPTQAGWAPHPGEVAWLGEVAALKAQGKVINAIKLYREKTGLGLKEAKDAVEAMP
jgi:large subunit ribosomal protein L7/L12